MQDQIKIIKQILDCLDSYQQEVGNSDIKQFAIYLKDKVVVRENKLEADNFNKEEYLRYKEMPKIEFSTLLTALYRFARIYVKKAFQDTNIKTIDEFGFLASILKEKSLIKNELIKMHFLEISSGSEILKRLLKNGLIYEFPDEKDGRSKRVSLTEKGFKEIMTAFEEMHKVSEIVVGNLNDEEIKESLLVFNKLNFFHINIQDKSKNDSVDNIYKNYICNSKK
jgi:DNA-binding MarR family transcriptional regulator